MTTDEYAKHMAGVARRLLGDPSSSTKTNLREEQGLPLH
jgi:hypothetical protein